MKLSKGTLITIFVILLLVIDQVIKIVIKLNMTIGESIPIFGDWSQILFIENNGMAFGLQFGGVVGKLLLSLLRIVLIGVIIWFLITLFKQDKLYSLRGEKQMEDGAKKKLSNSIKAKKVPNGVFIGVALILVGAIGNMIDSAFYGLIFSESTYSDTALLFPQGGGYAPFLCGRVVDMFYFPMIDTILPDWVPFWGGDNLIFFRPIFNFADSCVSVGVIYLLIFHRKFFGKHTEN